MILSNLLPDKVFLKWKYQRRFGKTLDLNHPKTFNEKIQWLKLYDRKPIYTTYADKYNVRAYISAKIGEEYLVPVVLHTENIKDITPEKLPDYPVIIKPTHDSAGSIIVKDKTTVDWKQIRKKLKRSLQRNFYYVAREWQYKDINPSIIVEKLLLDKNGNTPYDYKLHCFNEKVEFIQVFTGNTMRANIYNTQWELQPSFWSTKKTAIDFTIKIPQTLNEMIQIAETLALDSTYLRVDLYTMNDKIYFGELTLHDGAGFEAFNNGFDEKLGNLMQLPKS